MKSFSQIMVAVIFLSICFGCAFVDQNIGLTYTPVVNVRGGTGTITVAKPVLTVLKTNEKGQYIIGSVRDTRNRLTADTVTDDSPADWIALAFKTELELSGYRVELVEKMTKSTHKGITVDVKHIWLDTDLSGTGMTDSLGCRAELILIIKVFKNGIIVDNIFVREESHPRMSLMAFPFSEPKLKAKSMKMVIHSVMRSAVPQIVDALE